MTPKPQLQTPIAVQIFNRPEHERKVFERIKEVRPTKLFIIADGPRTEAERAVCEEARRVAESIVDWPCEVFKNYADKNMGVQERPITGFTWVFENVDRAIIFDDDCVPDLSFFYYCDELLEKYKDDTKVMHVAGYNYQQGNKEFNCPDSYYFSAIPHCWGWATWARAWKLYDRSMPTWPEVKASGKFREIYKDPAVYDNWELRYDRYHSFEINSSWDGAWAYTCNLYNGLCATPKTNLITNVGNDGTGAHWLESENKTDIPSGSLSFPLTHPKEVRVNEQADQHTNKYFFSINRYASQRIRNFFKFKFPLPYRKLKKLYRKV